MELSTTAAAAFLPPFVDLTSPVRTAQRDDEMRTSERIEFAALVSAIRCYEALALAIEKSSR